MRKVAILWIIFTTVFSFCLHGQKGLQEGFGRAVALYDNGMWSAAERELRKTRESVTEPGDPLALKCDFMIALCAAEASENYAGALLEDFLKKYPHTIYHNDVLFALAGEQYKSGDWQQAMAGYLAVDPFSLPERKQDEFHFRLGHCYFNAGDAQAAYRNLRQVDKKSGYGPSATYYLAYMDYASGNYGSAKQGFRELASDPQYGPIAPFYILQIEFLEGNYQYVTQNADKLIASTSKTRAMDIARITAESWYHLGNHGKSLEYLALYKSLGGEMGREESYIEGYCLYMTGSYRDAATALAAACGTDDALSQNAGYHLADCYLKLGEKRLAMQSFSIASVGQFDESIREDALFNYGKLQYELGGGVFNEAITILNRYIREYPSSSRINQAREYLLAAYYNSRNYEAAYDAIQLIQNPDNNVKAALQKITYFRALEFFNSGNLDEAQRLLEVSARNRYNVKYTALTNYWRGETAYRRGDFKAAIPLFREYITLSPKTEPEHAAAHYAVGYCYFNLKQWTEAEDWFNRFLAQGQVSGEFRADTYNRLGDIQYALRKFWPALEEYDKTIKLATPQKDYAEWRRAVLLGMVDRPQGKIDGLKAIVAAGRSQYKDAALYELGRTYMNQERFQDAASTLENYIASYPSGASRMDALSDLALVYQNLGRSDRALESYKKIVEAAPNTSYAKDAMTGIRSIYVEKNDVDSYFAYAAEKGMESDITAIQRDSLSFASAERLYLAGSNPKGAATAMQNYLKNYPRGAYRLNALNDLADCALRAGDRAASMEAWKELADMPHNDYTVRALQNLSRMQEEDKLYGQAEASYRKLSRTATVPADVNRAFEGYVRMAIITGHDLAAVADEVLASPHAGATVTRQASFIKAKALASAGHNDQALAIYEKLGRETQSAEGAESAFRVIEARAAAGNDEQAKKLVFEMANQNSPHLYWTAQAFLILGDIYAKEGDNFQARATYQSIVDGYSIQGDGVLDTARERITNLK